MQSAFFLFAFWDCRFLFAQTSSQWYSLPKVIRIAGSFLSPSSQFGSLPKAYHFVIGFVATIGASLEEFAADVRAVLEAKLKNL